MHVFIHGTIDGSESLHIAPSCVLDGLQALGKPIRRPVEGNEKGRGVVQLTLNVVVVLAHV